MLRHRERLPPNARWLRLLTRLPDREVPEGSESPLDPRGHKRDYDAYHPTYSSQG